MRLGIDCMKVHEFFFSQLQKNQPIARSRSSISSPLSALEGSLSNVCHSYLKFAEEAFKTALDLVPKQERCHAKSHVTIERHWEKGQHFLLRGRAHHNMGWAMYEESQYYENAPKLQQGRHKPKDLLMKARKECNNAVLRAKSLRHNTVSIHGHPNSEDTSTQNNCSWTAAATIQSLEAIKLEALASGLHVACSWKLDHKKEAMERFNGFFGTVDTSDVLNYVTTEGVSPLEITEVLDETYLLAMRVAELSIQSLECLPKKKDWNPEAGEEFLRITRMAMNRAASVSDHLLSFADQHSPEYEKERIVTRTAISKEENDICKLWETMKSQAHKNLSDVAQSSRTTDALRAAIPRMEVAGGVGTASGAAPLTRRIFIQDGRSLQGRSTSYRTMSVRKNNQDDRTVGDRFSSEFGSNSTVTTVGESSIPLGTDQTSTTNYRKWGNEVLEEHERKRCCPPLPKNFAEMGISIGVIRALEKKLGIILPASM